MSTLSIWTAESSYATQPMHNFCNCALVSQYEDKDDVAKFLSFRRSILDLLLVQRSAVRGKRQQLP